MFGMGILLRIEDFRRIYIEPRAVLTGLACQIIVLPLTAFIIALLFDFSTSAKIGLILVAACPAGASPNLIIYYLQGRVALAVSITAISSLIILITIPFIVSLALHLFAVSEQDQISLPLAETIVNICLTILFPITVGVLIKKYRESLANTIEKVMQWVMPLIFLAAFGGTVYFEDNGNIELSKYINMYPYAMALNFFAMIASYLVARYLLNEPKTCYTISTVVGIQNVGLAIFIANTLLEEPELAIMAIVYSSFTFFTTALFAFLAKKIG